MAFAKVLSRVSLLLMLMPLLFPVTLGSAGSLKLESVESVVALIRLMHCTRWPFSTVRHGDGVGRTRDMGYRAWS